MNNCIEIITDKKYSENPSFEEIHDDLRELVSKGEFVYFGAEPDNDSDGQDELLNNSTVFRLVTNKHFELSERMLWWLEIELTVVDKAPTISKTIDKGQTKTDEIINVYF